MAQSDPNHLRHSFVTGPNPSVYIPDPMPHCLSCNCQSLHVLQGLKALGRRCRSLVPVRARRLRGGIAVGSLIPIWIRRSGGGCRVPSRFRGLGGTGVDPLRPVRRGWPRDGIAVSPLIPIGIRRLGGTVVDHLTPIRWLRGRIAIDPFVPVQVRQLWGAMISPLVPVRVRGLRASR